MKRLEFEAPLPTGGTVMFRYAPTLTGLVDVQIRQPNGGGERFRMPAAALKAFAVAVASLPVVMEAVDRKRFPAAYEVDGPAPFETMSEGFAKR